MLKKVLLTAAVSMAFMSGYCAPAEGLSLIHILIEHISELKSQGAKIIKGDNIKAMEQAAKPELMRKNLGLR